MGAASEQVDKTYSSIDDVGTDEDVLATYSLAAPIP